MINIKLILLFWQDQKVINMEEKKSFKQLREEKSISQLELSQKTGLSAAIISKYENGLTKPRGSNLILIANALNVSVDQLTESINYIEPKESDYFKLNVKGSLNNEIIQLSLVELEAHSISTEKLMAFKYKSYLMNPIVNFGDIVVVDRSNKRPSDGSVIAIESADDTLILRKVNLRPDGKIQLSVTDPNTISETYDSGDLEIYGRVVYRKGFI